MPMYRVRLYPIVCVAVDNVETETPQAALALAEDAADLYRRFDDHGRPNDHSQPKYNRTPLLVEFTEYVDAIDSSYVEELQEGSDEALHTWDFGSDGQISG